MLKYFPRELKHLFVFILSKIMLLRLLPKLPLLLMLMIFQLSLSIKVHILLFILSIFLAQEQFVFPNAQPTDNTEFRIIIQTDDAHMSTALVKNSFCKETLNMNLSLMLKLKMECQFSIQTFTILSFV